MTLEQAEKEYKFCNGNEDYYMYKEIGPEAYKEYTALNITDDIKAKWDSDIIEQYLGVLEEGSNKSYLWLSYVMDALNRGYCETEAYALRVLDVLEKMVDYDDEDKVYIIDVMGHAGLRDNSGCRFFCTKTPYGKWMNELVHRIMDFKCSEERKHPKGPRLCDLYDEFVAEYEKEYARYSDSLK